MQQKITDVADLPGNEFYDILNLKRYGASCKPAPADKLDVQGYESTTLRGATI
jgi:hypothetical protein